MSRVINIDGPGKIRNQARRTCAEILRHLGKKAQIDDEAKDMLACLVFALREINDTIEHSAEAWESRDYWMKAEELRRAWTWAGLMADEINHLLRQNSWDQFPKLMVSLFEKFGEIPVKKFTRTADTWIGSYERLMKE